MEQLLDKIFRKLTERHIPPGRFVASTVIAIILALLPIGFIFLDPDVADYDLPPYQPNTSLENVALVTSRVIFVTIDWPLTVAAFVGGDRLVFDAFFPLLILIGLFWASIVEWILARTRRVRPDPVQDSNRTRSSFPNRVWERGTLTSR